MVKAVEITEGWSAKYKRSINCSNPKGFSQKAHCAGRKKNEGIAEGSSDDIEDTKQFKSAIALAKTQKAIRQAKYGKAQKFYADGTPVTPEEVARRAAERKAKKQGVAEGTLNEYRDALYDFVKSKFPTWPEYVLKDFLYSQAKKIQDKEQLKDWLERNQKDFGQVKWRLEKLPITLDIFTPKTQRMIKQRAGGSSNPMQVPKDAERHAQQLKMIQQQGVRTEPIIVAKLNNGYDLIEGWHRTIQHLQQYPEGYTGPAWVAYGATYTSESKQGVAENFADGKVKGKSRPGRVERAGASCDGSVTELRAKAKNASGEKAKMYHWCANMKAGKKKSVSEELEEGWKDWVAGGAMALGAMGAQAGNISTQIVDPGDTVYKIARDNGVHPSVIMKLNGFNNQTKLVPGQEVKVPDVYKATPTKSAITKGVEKAQPKATPKPVSANTVAPITGTKAEQILMNTAMRSGITGTELAAFMAQMAHESHDFKSMVEYGGSLDFRKYDPKYAPKKAKQLGNKYVGDGAKFKGRGYVQITGRYNYGIASKAIGVDLVKNPKLAENPAIAAKIAVWYWKHRVQPNVSNFNDVKAVTKPINPGLRGLEDRKDYFDEYLISLASTKSDAS